jgi:hypothetical protein
MRLEVLKRSASHERYGTIFVPIAKVDGHWRRLIHGTTNGLGFRTIWNSGLTASPVTPAGIGAGFDLLAICRLFS